MAAAAAAAAIVRRVGICTGTATGSGRPATSVTTVFADTSCTAYAAAADLNVKSFKPRYRTDGSRISSSASSASKGTVYSVSAAAAAGSPGLDRQLITPYGNLVCGVGGS